MKRDPPMTIHQETDGLCRHAHVLCLNGLDRQRISFSLLSAHKREKERADIKREKLLLVLQNFIQDHINDQASIRTIILIVL